MKKTVLLLVTCCLTLALGATQAFAETPTQPPCKNNRWSTFSPYYTNPCDYKADVKTDNKVGSKTNRPLRQ